MAYSIHIRNYLPKRRPRSLAQTLALTTLSISALTLIIVSDVGMYVSYKAQMRAVGAQQTLMAQNAARNVQDFVQDKINTLQGAIQFNYLAGIPASNPLSTLERLLSLQPAFNQVALLDANENEIGQASRLPNLYVGNITSQVNKQQLFTTVRQNKDFISNVYIDQASGEPQVLIAIPINSVYTGFSGTLVAEADLKFMWNLVGNIKDGAHGLAYVVDGNGTLIAAGDTSRVLKHENLANLTMVKLFLRTHQSPSGGAIHVMHGFNGSNVITTYATLGTPNWAVITEIPFSEVYNPLVKTLLIPLAGLILIGIVASVVASVLFARRITKPIMTLRDTANRFGKGDFRIKVITTGNDEISELGNAFNTMAANLQASTDNLSKEHSKLEASINSLKVGFIITDLAGNAIINPAARTILNYDKDSKTEPSRIDDFNKILGPDLSLQSAIDEVLKTVQPIERKAVDFNSRILRIFITPVVNSPHNNTVMPLGTVVLIEDITEERILERSKDEFFSIASHELRTPLTAIKGNSSMILKFYEKTLLNDDSRLKVMVEDIHSSSGRLIEIVNDFLDASKLEQGKMVYKNSPLDLGKIIENVIYETGVIFNEKGLYLKYEQKTLGTLPQVWADPGKTKQVIYNLVGNAMKFTEKGGVTIDIVPSSNRLVKVLISDTGRGIPKEGQALLFHKFQQTGTSLLTRDTTRGTGLGLYISKLFIEGMGGELKFEHSEVNKGTTFSFTLPVAEDIKTKLNTPVTRIDTNTGLSIVENTTP